MGLNFTFVRNGNSSQHLYSAVGCLFMRIIRLLYTILLFKIVYLTKSLYTLPAYQWLLSTDWTSLKDRLQLWGIAPIKLLYSNWLGFNLFSCKIALIVKIFPWSSVMSHICDILWSRQLWHASLTTSLFILINLLFQRVSLLIYSGTGSIE